MRRRKGNGLVQQDLGGGADNGYMSDLLSSGLVPPPLGLGFAWESLPLAFCLWFPGKTQLLAAGSSGSQLPFPDPSTPAPPPHTHTLTLSEQGWRELLPLPSCSKWRGGPQRPPPPTPGFH